METNPSGCSLSSAAVLNTVFIALGSISDSFSSLFLKRRKRCSEHKGKCPEITKKLSSLKLFRFYTFSISEI